MGGTLWEVQLCYQYCLTLCRLCSSQLLSPSWWGSQPFSKRSTRQENTNRTNTWNDKPEPELLSLTKFRNRFVACRISKYIQKEYLRQKATTCQTKQCERAKLQKKLTKKELKWKGLSKASWKPHKGNCFGTNEAREFSLDVFVRIFFSILPKILGLVVTMRSGHSKP